MAYAIAAIVAVIIIAVLLVYIITSHKKSPGPASVRYHGVTVDVMAEPLENALREIRAYHAAVKREGAADKPDFERLQDAARNFEHEWHKLRESNLLDHPGYMPPRQQNGESRTDKTHGHSTEPTDAV